jgi:transglutaminase-like putative cysteine protease
MRGTIAATAAAGLLGLIAWSPVSAEEIPRSALGPRIVGYTYEVTLTVPPGAKLAEVAMPLPREDDQNVLAIDLSGPGSVSVRPLPSGDRMAFWRIEGPGESVVVRQTGKVARREVHADTAHADGAVIDPAVFASALAASPSVQINDDVRAIAQRETAGKDDVMARARALYDWVYGHMNYDKSVPGWGLGDVPYCLKVGKGNCTDFHTLFIALARANGIPARWNIGFPLAYGDGTAQQGDPVPVAGYHCWAEFFAPGTGWVPVDISEARKHPELHDYFFGTLSGNRILFSRLRDAPLALGDADRARNYFIYPVARVDGVEMSDGIAWRFAYQDH